MAGKGTTFFWKRKKAQETALLNILLDLAALSLLFWRGRF
jgi:hypothetical protein